MPLADPEELLKELNAIIDKQGPLSSQDKDSLSGVYNCISDLSRKPTIQKVLRSNSVQAARIENQFTLERQQLEAHKSFVESNFDKADQYVKTIQIAGYTAYFAIWGMTRQWLNPSWAKVSILAMTFSATLFALWEVYKSTILTLAMKHHATISISALEDFINRRSSNLIQSRSRITELTKARAWVWLFCVIPALFSMAILLWQFIRALFTNIVPMN